MLRIVGAWKERAGEIRVDEYIALSIDWPHMPGLLWWTFDAPGTMLETGFDARTGELADVTLVLPGRIARVEQGPPAAAPRVVRGVPRCDPAEWARRAPGGSVRDLLDHYVRDPRPLRTELGADHLLVRIGESDAEAASEIACGRLRAGLSGDDSLLWICVDGFPADDRALLDEHAERSLHPPTGPAPVPGTKERASWFRLLDRLRPQ